MSRKIKFFYDPQMKLYDFGPQHPLRPERLPLALDLMLDLDVLQPEEIYKPEPATIEDALTCHSRKYLEFLRDSTPKHRPNEFKYGFGFGDNPWFPEVWESSLLYSCASIAAAETVIEDPTTIGINLSGGLHHAMRDKASGFCVLNDPAMAIDKLKTRWCRIAYIDIDLHHGDGVQWLFYNDPNVLTCSIHESGRWLFPGTGDVKESGSEGAELSSFNIPLAPGTNDEIWQKMFTQALIPVLLNFKPEAIVLQMGCDPHLNDPLGHLELSAQGWVWAVEQIVNLGIPLVTLGGGGYNVKNVVRMWTSAVAILKGVEVAPKLPAELKSKHGIDSLVDVLPMSGRADEIEIQKAQKFSDNQFELIRSTFTNVNF